MFLKKSILYVIRIYQVLFRQFPRACRFSPSCSQYCLDAVGQYGVPRGLFLGMKRVLKCHPLHPGGYDPVPKVKSKN